MWNAIVSVPGHCLFIYFVVFMRVKCLFLHCLEKVVLFNCTVLFCGILVAEFILHFRLTRKEKRRRGRAIDRDVKMSLGRASLETNLVNSYCLLSSEMVPH